MLARMLVLALVPACWTGNPPPATPAAPPRREPTPCELGAGAPIATAGATLLRVRAGAKVAAVGMTAASPDGRVTTMARFGGLLASGDIVVSPGTFTVEVTDEGGRRTLCKNVVLAIGHRTTLHIHRFVCAAGQDVCTPL